MARWENVTNTFSEERRHYLNTYLEKCEVYDGTVEVSIFSSESQPYEIYVSYGRMYGIIYSNAEDAYAKFEPTEIAPGTKVYELVEKLAKCHTNDTTIERYRKIRKSIS